MTTDFTTTILVNQTPDEAFAAINNVRGWWTGTIEGRTDKVGETFTYRYGDIHYSKHEITELVPGKRIVWLVVDSHLGSFADKREWNGTHVTFDIAKHGDQTEVRFSHVGLVPEVQCYGACSRAWGSYVTGSLRNLIAAVAR